MKKVTYLGMAFMMALTFSITSCESKTAQNVENSTESAAEELEQEASELKDKADSELAPTDTITVKDEPVNDGVGDKADH